MTGSDAESHAQGASTADALVALAPEAQTCVRHLQDLQAQHDQIEAALRREMDALERKFRLQCVPLYEERARLLKTEPGVPRFWLTAMKNHFMLAATITDTDELALAALLDIRALLLEPGHGFRLEFEFAPNDYFSDRLLSKTYRFKPAHAHDHAPAPGAPACCDETSATFEGAEGCTIHWLEGKNLCLRTVTKTQRHKTKNATRTVTKTEPCESFFNFFAPPALPDLSSDSVTQEEFEDLSEAVEMDLEFGEIFRTKIVPEAVNCFLGIAEGMQSDDEDDFGEDEDDFDEDDEDHEDDEDDDEEEDEDDEEDEEEEEEDASRAHRQGRKAASKSSRRQMPAGAAQQQPQCKQQ